MRLASTEVATRTTRDHRTRYPAGRLGRGLLAAALALPLMLGAAACGKDGGTTTDPNAPVELSFFWWGGEARAKLTEDALALYTKKHPNVTFKKTWQANQGYFDKLATLTAGGAAPDIFQIDDIPDRVRGAQRHARPQAVPGQGQARPVEVPAKPRPVRCRRRQARRCRLRGEHAGSGLQQDAPAEALAA